MEGLEGRLGVLVRNLMTMKMVYWVNLSESSGAGSPGLSSINKWPLNGYCLPPTKEEVNAFVCLSVCLLARLLKNACTNLDEILRDDRCWDMDELINF